MRGYGLGALHLNDPLVLVAMLVLGPVLIFGCIRGILSREGMYDRGSTEWMLLSQIIGILLGLLMLLYAFVNFRYVLYGV